MTKESIEPILSGENERYVIYPPDPKYKDLWDLYKKHSRGVWAPEDIIYTSDLKQWNEMSEDQRYFIEMILAFFAGSDGIVMENLVENFAAEVKISEARAFYATQSYIEIIHGETYALLLDTLVTDQTRKTKLFNAIDQIDVVKAKADWAKKYMNPGITFRERIVAFAVVEGVFFSGAFCAIFWLRDQGLMAESLGKSNEWIARDEGLHVEFAVALFHKLQTKPSVAKINQIVKDAVEIEEQFITKSIPCEKLLGMSSELMTEYIKYVADRLLQQLGYPKVYHSECPFTFMQRISMPRVTNFFESRVSEYSKPESSEGVSNAAFTSTEDF
jgi:ribonucleotide reductase beta subunit family protein with ferritin-like domain